MTEGPAGAEVPPEWKLGAAISVAGLVLSPVLGDLPSDPRVREVLATLSRAIHHLAAAHIDRLKGRRGWEQEAQMAWGLAASVEHLVVQYHDTPPFDGLGAIQLSVESVADALLNHGPGDAQEEQRRKAVALAERAMEELEGTSGPYLTAAANAAHLLAEGSFATQPPPDGTENLISEEQGRGVDPDDVPYPPQPFVITPHGRIPLPDGAIDGGSAQCRDLTVREAEGILCFFDDEVTFDPDRGGHYAWPYDQIESYSITGGWVSILGMRNLTLRVQGRRFRFRVGRILATNADYILRTVGVHPR
jgi:hypothetical protein